MTHWNQLVLSDSDLIAVRQALWDRQNALAKRLADYTEHLDFTPHPESETAHTIYTVWAKELEETEALYNSIVDMINYGDE